MDRVPRKFVLFSGLIVFGLAAALLQIGGDAMPESGESETLVSLPGTIPSSDQEGVRPTPTPATGRSGLRHDVAPDPALFREYRQLQTVYDQEAKPGEFVTPPSVSVEH